MVSRPRKTTRLRVEAAPLLHDQVVAELRRAIITGRFAPGERLVEARLAQEMGISRIPVREAIRALAFEGLVELTARRGASVLQMSPRVARETIELRALLEGQNARLAARGCDPLMQARITAVLKKGTDAVEAGRLDLLPELNARFHEELELAGRNSVLADMLLRLRIRTAVLFASSEHARQRDSWDEHAGILRSIIEGDEEAAAERAAAHVILSGQPFLDELEAACTDVAPEKTPRPKSTRTSGRTSKAA